MGLPGNKHINVASVAQKDHCYKTLSISETLSLFRFTSAASVVREKLDI